MEIKCITALKVSLEVSVWYFSFSVCMGSRVNSFNYSNKTGGQCNKAGGKRREGPCSLHSGGEDLRMAGSIYGETNAKKKALA